MANMSDNIKMDDAHGSPEKRNEVDLIIFSSDNEGTTRGDACPPGSSPSVSASAITEPVTHSCQLDPGTEVTSATPAAASTIDDNPRRVDPRAGMGVERNLPKIDLMAHAIAQAIPGVCDTPRADRGKGGR